MKRSQRARDRSSCRNRGQRRAQHAQHDQGRLWPYAHLGNTAVKQSTNRVGSSPCAYLGSQARS